MQLFYLFIFLNCSRLKIFFCQNEFLIYVFALWMLVGFVYLVCDFRNGLFLSFPLEMLHTEYTLWQAKAPI